jgi:hypothetical protein
MAHGSLASFYLNGIEMGAFEAVLAPNALKAKIDVLY